MSCVITKRYSLPQQELVNSLLFPHALYNQPVQVDKQSAAKTTGNPADRQITVLCPVKSRSWGSLMGSQFISCFSTGKHISIKQIKCDTRQYGNSLSFESAEQKVNFMPCSLNANQPSGWTVSVTGTSSGISVMWRRSGETCSPEDGERRQLLKVKREVQAETGLKESSDGLWGERGLLSLCRRHSTHMLHTPGAPHQMSVMTSCIVL